MARRQRHASSGPASRSSRLSSGVIRDLPKADQTVIGSPLCDVIDQEAAERATGLAGRSSMSPRPRSSGHDPAPQRTTHRNFGSAASYRRARLRRSRNDDCHSGRHALRYPRPLCLGRHTGPTTLGDPPMSRERFSSRRQCHPPRWCNCPSSPHPTSRVRGESSRSSRPMRIRTPSF